MVVMLLGKGFEESEAIVPLDLLRRAGVEVSTAALEGSQVTGSHGVTVTADCGIAQVDADQVEMLILPGGLGGVSAIAGCPAATALIQRVSDRGGYVAAICAAPTILAGMGITDRRRAVCYPGMEEQMGSAVVQPGDRVVVDGRIVTGEAAGSAFAFGLKLVELLRGKQAAQEVCNAVHYHF